MAAPGSGSAQYIIDHYGLRATGIREKSLQTVVTLITNGLYYQQVNNPVSALVSFSSAASYLYALKEAAGDSKSFDTTLNTILGHVEALQQKTQMIGTGDKKDEEDVSWAKDCINMCETKSNSLCLTFADVIGMTKEKNTMVTSIIKPLVYPNLFTKSAKGVLLYGPPGTGKTFLVKALVRQLQIEYADSAQVLFFPLTGADLKGKYVGETEKKIVRAYTCAARRACQATDPFNEDSVCTAKDANKVLKNLSESANQKIAKSPQYVSVIFIDEFDSIGGDRSNDDTGLVANSVNTLLQMMDGIVSFKNIITVAATNYPWSLDPALLRRFNEHIYCTVPSINHIKLVVEMEMKQRFIIQKENQRDFCAVGIDSKVFKPSQELAKFVGQKKEKGGCGPSVEERIKNASWPLNIIDRRYMAMDSPEAEALIVYMKTENYSNSDIASVVQKAFNITSETCINDGTWFRITPGAKSFIEEATTDLENLRKQGATQTQIILAENRVDVLKAQESEESATEAYASEIQQLAQLIYIPQIKPTDTNPAYIEDIVFYETELGNIKKDKKQIAVLKAAALAEELAATSDPTVGTTDRDALKAAEDKYKIDHPTPENEIFLALVNSINKHNRYVGDGSKEKKSIEEKILANVSVDEQELSKRIKQLYEEKNASDAALKKQGDTSSARAVALATATADASTKSAAFDAAEIAERAAQAELERVNKTVPPDPAAVTLAEGNLNAAKAATASARDASLAATAAVALLTKQSGKPDETVKYEETLKSLTDPILSQYQKGTIEKNILPACKTYLEAVDTSIKANCRYILNSITCVQSLTTPDARTNVAAAVESILRKPRRTDIADMLTDYAYATGEFACKRNSKPEFLTAVPSHYKAALEKAAELSKVNNDMACQYKIAYLRLNDEQMRLETLLKSCPAGKDVGTYEAEKITADIAALEKKISDHKSAPYDIFKSAHGKEIYDIITAPARKARDEAIGEYNRTHSGKKSGASPISPERTKAGEDAFQARVSMPDIAAPLFTKIQELEQSLKSQKEKLTDAITFIKSFGASLAGPIDLWESKQRWYREKSLYAQRVSANTDDFVKYTNDYIYADLLVSQMKLTSYKNSVQKREEYFISKMTKIIKDVDPNTYNLIDSAATHLEQQAKRDSIYDKGRTDSKLQVPPTVIIDMFGGSAKNIFGNPKKTRMITSINFYSKKYINSKLIKDLPAELIFKDDSIGDILFTVSDVKKYRATKSNIDAHNNTFIHVMFTRVISVMNDNAAAVILPKKHGIVATLEKITNRLEELAPMEHLGSNEAEEIRSLLEPLITYNDELLAAHTEIVRIANMPRDWVWRGRLTREQTEAFKTWINDYGEKFLRYDEQKILTVALAYYKAQQSQITALFAGAEPGGSVGSRDNCNTITTSIDNLINFANNFADCIDDLSKEELGEARKYYAYNSVVTGTSANDVLVSSEYIPVYNEMMTLKIIRTVDLIIRALTERKIDAFNGPGNNDPAKTVKKVFFFVAKIRPFGAAWTQLKAGGWQWSDGIGATASTWWQALVSRCYSAASVAKVPAITENEIRAEIARSKRTAADYLLTRTTHIGVCNGADDSVFYEIADDEKKEKKMCPEIPEVDEEEEEDDEVVVMKKPDTVRAKTIDAKIKAYKEKRAAALKLKGHAALAGLAANDDPDSETSKKLETLGKAVASQREQKINEWTKKLSTIKKDASAEILAAAKILNPKFVATGGTRKNSRTRVNLTRRIGGASSAPAPKPEPADKKPGKGIDDLQPQNVLWFVIPLDKTRIDPINIIRLAGRTTAISLLGRMWLPQGEMEVYLPNLVIAAMFMNDNIIVNKLSSDFSNLPEIFNINYHKAVVQRGSYINRVLNIPNFKLIRYERKYDETNMLHWLPYLMAAWGINTAADRYFGKNAVFGVFSRIGQYFKEKPPTVAGADVFKPSPNSIIAAGAKGETVVVEAVGNPLAGAEGPLGDPALLEAAQNAAPGLRDPMAIAGAVAVEKAAGPQIVALGQAREALAKAMAELATPPAGATTEQLGALAAAVPQAQAEVAAKLVLAEAAIDAAATPAAAAARAALPAATALDQMIEQAKAALQGARAALRTGPPAKVTGAAKDAAIAVLQGEVDKNIVELAAAEGGKLAQEHLAAKVEPLVNSVITNMKSYLANPPPVLPPATLAEEVAKAGTKAYAEINILLATVQFALSAAPAIEPGYTYFVQKVAIDGGALRLYLENKDRMKVAADGLRKDKIRNWLKDYDSVGNWSSITADQKASWAPFDDCPPPAVVGGSYSDNEEDYEEYEEMSEYEDDSDEESFDEEGQSGGSGAPRRAPPRQATAPSIPELEAEIVRLEGRLAALPAEIKGLVGTKGVGILREEQKRVPKALEAARVALAAAKSAAVKGAWAAGPPAAVRTAAPPLVRGVLPEKAGSGSAAPGSAAASALVATSSAGSGSAGSGSAGSGSAAPGSAAASALVATSSAGSGSAGSGSAAPGSAAASALVATSSAGSGSAGSGSAGSGSAAPGSAAAPALAAAPTALAAAPPPPPATAATALARLDAILRNPVETLTKADICNAYHIFCSGAAAAGANGFTNDVKGKYILILLRFIAYNTSAKVKSELPKMDKDSLSICNNIVYPLARAGATAAFTIWGLPAAVAFFGGGSIAVSAAFITEVAIRLVEADSLRESQMSALEREITTYLQTNAPSNYVQVNVKEVIQTGSIDRTKCLNFYMDPGFLKAAADSYPSTWNKENGIKFAEYDTNRAQFMAKEAAARDARKNR